MTQAFPLQWPEGWPRTPSGRREDGRIRFKRPGSRGWQEPWTFAAARDALLEELARLGVTYPVISSNYPIGRGGVAVEAKRTPQDTGIAIYFMRKGKPFAMACDRFHDAEGNMRSLALAIDAMRQLERHGGGIMMERAFAGFAALPAPGSKRAWREVFGFGHSEPITVASLNERYRSKAKAAHPDAPGGTAEEMAELNAARDEALKEISK
ncbi:J domain-containing protein [Labrys neptuniae]|uniref:J domain-containing protein n=1 Tax=Labrys neptuniae TaxID=376174 RepID=A0ABV3PFV5_9HYPH